MRGFTNSRHEPAAVIALGLFFGLVLGCVHRDVPPPVPPSIEVDAAPALEVYGEGVASAFMDAAVKFRSNASETQINKEMFDRLNNLPEKSFQSLMDELGRAKSREAKADLLERWGSELGGTP